MLQTTGGRKILRVNFSCLIFVRRKPFSNLGKQRK